jgi:hypothetical protein
MPGNLQTDSSHRKLTHHIANSTQSQLLHNPSAPQASSSACFTLLLLLPPLLLLLLQTSRLAATSLLAATAASCQVAALRTVLSWVMFSW